MMFSAGDVETRGDTFSATRARHHQDDKGHTVADLAAYMVLRGGNAAQVDGWSAGKNPRGDKIFTDPSGRVFRSRPEVARFLNVGQA